MNRSQEEGELCTVCFSDLGSSAKRWRNIYTTDLHLQNERGNWTVIEEENYLTLRNNKTDKVYKLVMEEIK